MIVTYNSEAHIGACLDAALRTDAEIVVVDNASRDGTREEVEKRGVRLIANAENRGFAAAVNQGFAVLTGSYVLVLNPDSVLIHGLDALREACDLPGAAGAGGQLLDESGRPQTGFMIRRLPTPASLIFELLLLNRIWPGSPVNRRYRCLDLDYRTRQEVEQPAGAMLMVRRTVWHELGGFDEGYFPLWFEDVDFCRRARDGGYRFFYVPEAVAKHTGGHSIQDLPVEKRRVYWYGSLLRYSARHFSPLGFRLICLAVITGAIPRVVYETVSEGDLKPIAGYVKVVRLAGRCLWSGWEK